MSDYDPLYIEFLYYFNLERDYYECHEVMEELWLEEGRNPLYQGLLQAAVGLYHFDNNNLSGAIKLFSAGIEKMDSADGADLGINLPKFIKECKEYLSRLERYEEESFAFYPLDIEIVDPALVEKVDALAKEREM